MNTSRYYQYIFPGTIAFSVVLMLIGLSMGHPEQLLSGLWKIVTMQDLLITDYIHIAGPAAAFVNAGLVTIISILIIKLAKDPFNGFTIVEMGLMAGFSLFGKNVFNIWPIILGTWLYARYQKEPFSKYAVLYFIGVGRQGWQQKAYQNTGEHAQRQAGVNAAQCHIAHQRGQRRRQQGHGGILGKRLLLIPGIQPCP